MGPWFGLDSTKAEAAAACESAELVEALLTAFDLGTALRWAAAEEGKPFFVPKGSIPDLDHLSCAEAWVDASPRSLRGK